MNNYPLWKSLLVIIVILLGIIFSILDISVIAPLKSSDKTLFHFEAFRFSLFSRKGGYPPELENDSDLQDLARTFGRNHSLRKSKIIQKRP